jgi:hypothetical protein
MAEWANDEPPWRFTGTARVTIFPSPVAAGPLLALGATAAAQTGFADEARALLSEALRVTVQSPSSWRKERVLDDTEGYVRSYPELAAHHRSVTAQIRRTAGRENADASESASVGIEDRVAR